MPKALTNTPNFLYPFCQYKDYSLLKIGAYTWKQRWQVINRYLLKKDTYENVSLYPSLRLLTYVQQHKKLPHPLYNYCLALLNPVEVLKHSKEILQFDILTQKIKATTNLPNTILTTTKKNIYLAEGVSLQHCYMNTEAGPIYLGKNVQIQEGVCLRGPLYIGENSIIKMGATIYGTTIIGNNCVIGGEVKNSIVQDYSNKAHYGYLGDSIIGEWCNLGAGTTNSNVKNNASDVVLLLQSKKINAGLKFGLLMGDFSRSAINTSFNTGTVVGLSCNIFSNGLTPKSIANFSWGMEGEKYDFEKAIKDIEKWMELKPPNPLKGEWKKWKKKINTLYNINN